MDARERCAKRRVLADHDRAAAVVRERGRLRDHELARGGAHRERAFGGRRELQMLVVRALQGDDAERTRERIGEARDEAVRDLAAQRGVAENPREVAPLPLACALSFGLAPPAQTM